MKKMFLLAALAVYSTTTVYSQHIYHVAISGNDRNDGTNAHPLQTISAAASLAMPGDTVLVHKGVYREQINPPRGGTSESMRITYMAAPGEQVVITGSEPVVGWKKVQNDVWEVAIPNSFFGKFNPYKDLVSGDWFGGLGRQHHTGAIYLNGDWMIEATKKEDLFTAPGDKALWFAEVGSTTTTIWAQFLKIDPNQRNVEINVRQKVFYPEKTGINYLIVKGFTMRQAATNWAPPTAEQMGIIGTNWSKGWIIEDNDVSYSRCSGIALGKHGDKFDNTSANTAEGYVETVKRALANGWNKSTIGGHIVRNNAVSHCEQAGIVGSLGCSFSTVTGNSIHDIHMQRLFTGAEMAGIKFHGAIDVKIAHNHIYNTVLGVWLDWMAQGTRVTGNLFNDNDRDMFIEVDHGPYLVDNNFLLSTVSLLDMSEGGAFVHNIICGKIDCRPQGRQTPYFKPHSTDTIGLAAIKGGDMRFYNNIFLVSAKKGMVAGDHTYWMGEKAYGLRLYYDAALPVVQAGNMYLYDSTVKIVGSSDKPMLQIESLPAVRGTVLVTTELLGKAIIPDCRFENPDGSPLVIDTDYFGRKRNENHPFPGPLEIKSMKKQSVKIW